MNVVLRSVLSADFEGHGRPKAHDDMIRIIAIPGPGAIW